MSNTNSGQGFQHGDYCTQFTSAVIAVFNEPLRIYFGVVRQNAFLYSSVVLAGPNLVSMFFCFLDLSVSLMEEETAIPEVIAAWQFTST